MATMRGPLEQAFGHESGEAAGARSESCTSRKPAAATSVRAQGSAGCHLTLPACAVRVSFESLVQANHLPNPRGAPALVRWPVAWASGTWLLSCCGKLAVPASVKSGDVDAPEGKQHSWKEPLAGDGSQVTVADRHSTAFGRLDGSKDEHPTGWERPANA